MTDYKFGTIVLVPFPLTDQTTSKKGLAVVISSAAYNEECPDLIVMAITTQVQTATTPQNVTDWQVAGLLKLSMIKPIMSASEKKLGLRTLGCLAEVHLKPLKLYFKQSWVRGGALALS